MGRLECLVFEGRETLSLRSMAGTLFGSHETATSGRVLGSSHRPSLVVRCRRPGRRAFGTTAATAGDREIPAVEPLKWCRPTARRQE